MRHPKQAGHPQNPRHPTGPQARQYAERTTAETGNTQNTSRHSPQLYPKQATRHWAPGRTQKTPHATDPDTHTIIGPAVPGTAHNSTQKTPHREPRHTQNTLTATGPGAVHRKRPAARCQDHTHKPHPEYAPHNRVLTSTRIRLRNRSPTEPARRTRQHHYSQTPTEHAPKNKHAHQRPQPYVKHATAIGPGRTQNTHHHGPSLPKVRQPGYQAAKHY